MATNATLVKGVWRANLTQANPEAEFDLTEITTGQRELTIGGDFGSGISPYVKIQRYLDDFVGWADILNINLDGKPVFQMDVLGGGYGFATYHRAGKIKFVLVNPDTDSDLKLSFLQ